MGKIHVELKNGIIIIQQISGPEVVSEWKKPVHELVFKKTENTDINVDRDNRYQIFLWENIEENVLLIYAKTRQVQCLFTTEKGAYLRLLERTNQFISASMTKKEVIVRWLGAVCNKFNLNISKCRFYLNEVNFREFDMPFTDKVWHHKNEKTEKYIHTFQFETRELVFENSRMSYRMRVSIEINAIEVIFFVKQENPGVDSPALISSVFYQQYALKIRRSFVGDVAFVQRPLEDIERTFLFRIMESKKISELLYYLGKLYKQKKKKKKIHLFYEKFAEKAEEGTYEVFLEALKSRISKSYYIIDKDTETYKTIRKQKNVVKKYSLKYYCLLYMASSYISTEAPVHVNLLNSNNRFFLKSIKENDFVFLQHGITYLKCHGKNSPFPVGKEGEPSYMIVGSEKEKSVASRMLGIPQDRILKTGLPVFDKIAYNHLSKKAKDIVLILFTWKPYEKKILDFEQSLYYQNIQRIYAVLQEKLSRDQIIIAAHPKTVNQLKQTALGQSIWEKPLSEALAAAKLLITDYSSTCYNTFYQGGGVVFFQEDIELYESENGKLIPEDDEYIGYRAFSMEELERILESGISNSRIMLERFRTEEFEKRYQTINEFCDGRNIERICKELKRLQFI